MKPITAIIVIVAIASLGCCLLFMISAEGEGEGKGKIVFSADLERPEPDIFSIDIDGKNLKNLTDHPAWDSFPAPSPNGRYIAFSSDRNGGKFAIFMMDTDGKNPKLLINSIFSITGVSWSPDSKWVAFIEGLYKLVAFNINTGERKEIIKNVLQIKEAGGGLLTYEPAWSPDGKKIALRILGAKDNKRADIYTIEIDENLNGANLRQLTNNDPEDDDNPAWSPDGKQIVFHSTQDGDGLFIMDSDGGNVKLLHRGGISADWSPDGKKIVFFTWDGIFIMNSDRSNVWQVFKEGGRPAWLEQRFFNIESEGRWKTNWGKVKRNF